MTKLLAIIAVCLIALSGCTYEPSGNADIVVYKNPNCGCCAGHVSAMEKAGFSVETIPSDNLQRIKSNKQIPPDMLSCHTSMVGDYFVEGHVPIEAINKLLEEKPNIDGIALPGMPSGSAGMPGKKQGTWIIYAIKDGEVSEFMKY